MKVSAGARGDPVGDDFGRNPTEVRVVDGSMTATHLALLREWIELNRDVIIRYWDGDIESTKDALAAIRPINQGTSRAHKVWG